ncbi:SOS response-associated peptidase [Parahaliea aestuarii]|uniref:Abasic site processing protein n=1 Tax=Parahaliea aestuarii TaxID=1852021 RepID=A0A5C8ZZU9_9GAMM|nr:SOS response-associated peptidase family protein [Parahaliea aestuarii]TXS93152.1 SOS response-associated peptidase [Parahaliea aestuarii]
MCGTYATHGSGTWREYRGQIDPQWPEPENPGSARFNLRPTDAVPLVRLNEGEFRIDDAHWWLIPATSSGAANRQYPMFNARAETLAEKRSYRGPFLRQRGVLPVSAFAERVKAGELAGWWSVSSEQGAIAVAALWDIWKGEGRELLSVTMVTTAAAPEFAPWHSRMPVMLTRDECDRWLDNAAPVPANDTLFRAELKFPLLLARLDGTVGNVRDKSPSTMSPVAAAIRVE